MDLVLQRTGQSLGELQYKECRDIAAQLHDGDLLSFFVEGPQTPRLGVGGFTLTSLPTAVEQPLLLAVMKRRGSLRATFASHAFADDPSASAQVAVMDTYQGDAGDQALRIAEVPKEVQQTEGLQLSPRMQELALNSIAMVNPGKYQVSLGSSAARPELLGAPASFVAEAGVSYVVLRVGENSTQQDASASFPEDVVVFPPPKAPERSTFASVMAKAKTMAAEAYTWVKGCVPL